MSQITSTLSRALFIGKFPKGFSNAYGTSVVVPYNNKSMDFLTIGSVIELTNSFTRQKVEVCITNRRELSITAVFNVEILDFTITIDEFLGEIPL